MPDHVVKNTGLTRWGGQLTQAVSSATLWSDGVIIATSWSETDPHVGGELFTFRGTITRSPRYLAPLSWRLEHADGTYVDTLRTRKDAIERSENESRRMLIRAIRAAQAA